ncbi:uncharacterized protein B0T15DRAFT_520900 [Chaetomium strumarium]|uniref:Uncharacterized protein n=1 Tax=Chaetomium strumarium TaxID=1170767 RepID=A0AAJ0H3Q9_9PEZI|nr:hypothetical protein B0T15DRAFT_520900 [Chaetomium strumarium]
MLFYIWRPRNPPRPPTGIVLLPRIIRYICSVMAAITLRRWAGRFQSRQRLKQYVRQQEKMMLLVGVDSSLFAVMVNISVFKVGFPHDAHSLSLMSNASGAVMPEA